MKHRRQVSADLADVSNVEAWVEVLEDLLHHVPHDIQAEVLALSEQRRKADEEERRKAEAENRLVFVCAADIKPTPARMLRSIEKLKCLLIQVFVRDITNNNSNATAKRLLTATQAFGHGSGRLSDYMRGIL